MKTRIAVPTDFSEFADTALNYALGYAKERDAQLVLLHVIPDIGPTLGRMSSAMLKREMINAAREQMQQLIDKINTENVQVEYYVERGASVASVIESFCKHQSIDLVIMGSKGASGLKKKFLGSNTVDVIDKSCVPVIVVPEWGHYSRINSIVYASDLKQLDSELEYALLFARLHGASLHILHIQSGGLDDDINRARLMETIQQKSCEVPVSVDLLYSNEVASAIEHYSNENKADLLILFTHRIGFLEHWLGKSVTREIAFHNHTPVLAINNR